MKNFFKFYVVFALLLVGAFSIPQNVGAVAANNQTITLSPGWNIVSTPKVLLSHQFSVAETSTNFDIYLLDPTSTSGWQTMQGDGQTEFTPLFAYFINNKTGQNQTLQLNYNFDLTPAQRLFQRTLQPGWNAIGIASPSYALPQGSISADTNNPGNILNSISLSANQVIDFTSGNANLDSPAISGTWLSKTMSDVNSLNDFRELKAYGVFVTNSTDNYIGSQNLSLPTLYTLTYIAGAHGSVTGTSTQTVISGSSGTAITAVPAGGYHFVDWSDGSTANPRTDTNVIADINVTANFTLTVEPSTLTVTASTNTPVSTSINVNATSGTTDVPMLVFNAQSTVGASKLTDLVFGVVATDVGMFNKVTAIKLYDGSTLLGSVSPVVTSGGTGTATFGDLTISVAKDATKVLTIKADIASGVTAEDTVYLTINPTTQVTYEQPDLTSGYAAGSIITGKTMYFFNGEAAVLSFVSSAATYTYNSTTPSASYATGVIVFDIKADGGTLTELINSKVQAEWNTTTLAAGNVSVSVSPNTNTPDGSIARVTVNMTVPRDTSGTGFVNFNIHSVKWTVGGSGEVTQTWGLDDYKTPYVNVQ